jgi:phenylacetate-CoA ligase
MSFFSKNLFRLSYKLFGRDEISLYDKFMLSDKLSFDELTHNQNNQLSKMVTYCYEQIPYYTKTFNAISIQPQDIKEIGDLKFLPVLTKSIIIENRKDFTPKVPVNKVIKGSTGGSTGEPLKYLMSLEDYNRGVALLYRGWSRAGYNLGDKVLIFAGSSLVGNATMFRNLTKWSRNFKSFSSYGVSEADLKEIILFMNRQRPLFVRGYASSIALLAHFLVDNPHLALNYQLKGIFTTAEMLSISQRTLIEKAFNAKVFDQYGLNDGGISAYENGELDGFLIDTERSIIEAVDEKNLPLFDTPGTLLATSLYNYAFPFLRYDTGDMGVISDDSLKKTSNRLLLKRLLGRSTDYIKINNKVIGSPVLTVLMGKLDVKKYQIIQRDDALTFLISKGPTFGISDEEFIIASMKQHLGEVNINFNYSPEFVVGKNKHKFIINIE